jgi:molybdopterin-containing oxidoreductase family iron-sulfur binding subunit
MGSALAMAGLSACSRPVEKILPYAKNPEELVPGKPWFYATAIPFPFGARGVLVASHMGRPVRIEGNPEHPDSLGASDIFSQSAVLSLYDPDRSQAVTHEGQIDSWQHFSAVAGARLDEERATKGAGLRILTGTVLSPTLAAQLQSFLRAFPEAKWHQYDPEYSSRSDITTLSLS